MYQIRLPGKDDTNIRLFPSDLTFPVKKIHLMYTLNGFNDIYYLEFYQNNSLQGWHTDSKLNTNTFDYDVSVALGKYYYHIMQRFIIVDILIINDVSDIIKKNIILLYKLNNIN